MLTLLLALACTEEPAATCTPAAERCDGLDNDCNGVVDDGFDVDGDGAYVNEPGCRAMALPIDCDDADASVRPGAAEVCFDGVDNDCSGAEDDALDADGDGFAACLDCDDTDAFVFPGAAEACDGVDNDCSGAADEPWDLDGDGAAGCGGDCDDMDPTRAPSVPEQCNGIDDDCDGVVDEGFDVDGDGWRTCRGDCDDADPLANPGAVEVCDGLENDCDPSTVDDVDTDGDGLTLCEGDCAPAFAGAYPGAAEACDGVDNDCDGEVDELPECFLCVQVDPTGEADLLACGAYVNWERADAACRSFGLQLPVVHDAARNGLLRDIGYYYFGGAHWLGLTDRSVEGTWAWVDASALDFQQWWYDEPNDSGGEDCAGTNYGDWGYWNDYSCAGALPFVCEAPTAP